MIKRIRINLVCGVMAATWNSLGATDLPLQTDRPVIGQPTAAALADLLEKKDHPVGVVKLFVKNAPPMSMRQEIATYFSFKDVKGLFEIARAPMVDPKTGKLDSHILFVRLLLQGTQQNYASVLEKNVLSRPHPFGQSCWHVLHNLGFISCCSSESLIKKATNSVKNFNGKFDLELLPRILLSEYLSGAKITSRSDKKVVPPLTQNERTFLGLWGDSHAQKDIAQDLANGWSGFQDPAQLEEYANMGWQEAQMLVAEGLAGGRYGFTQDLVKLEEYANKGWQHAQYYVAIDIINGDFGFTQNTTKLKKYADMGWEDAQWFVAEGLAKGEYGFTRNRTQLEEYANMGWENAQWFVVYGHAEGKYGFTRNRTQLEEYANMGWENAQWFVAESLAEGRNGFTRNRTQLEEYANMGWKSAQRFVAEGLAEGRNGFTPNQEQLITFSEGNLSLPAVQTAYGNFDNKTDRLLYALHVTALIFEKQYHLAEKRTNPAPYFQLLQAQKSEGQLSAEAFAG